MLSDEYRQLNERMHKEHKFDGADALRYVEDIKKLAARFDAKDAIDYGCGCASLGNYLGIPCQNYDPCIPKYSQKPTPADMVVSLDVLEHIEPEYVDETLAYIRSLCKVAFFVIALLPDGTKLLPDGTNPHKSLFPPNEWERRLRAHWSVVRKDSNKRPGEVVFACW